MIALHSHDCTRKGIGLLFTAQLIYIRLIVTNPHNCVKFPHAKLHVWRDAWVMFLLATQGTRLTPQAPAHGASYVIDALIQKPGSLVGVEDDMLLLLCVHAWIINGHWRHFPHKGHFSQLDCNTSLQAYNCPYNTLHERNPHTHYLCMTALLNTRVIAVLLARYAPIKSRPIETVATPPQQQPMGDRGPSLPLRALWACWLDPNSLPLKLGSMPCSAWVIPAFVPLHFGKPYETGSPYYSLELAFPCNHLNEFPATVCTTPSLFTSPLQRILCVSCLVAACYSLIHCADFGSWNYTFDEVWTEEDMGIPRVMGDAALLPNGDIIICNGDQVCVLRKNNRVKWTTHWAMASVIL